MAPSQCELVGGKNFFARRVRKWLLPVRTSERTFSHRYKSGSEISSLSKKRIIFSKSGWISASPCRNKWEGIKNFIPEGVRNTAPQSKQVKELFPNRGYKTASFSKSVRESFSRDLWKLNSRPIGIWPCDDLPKGSERSNAAVRLRGRNTKTTVGWTGKGSRRQRRLLTVAAPFT